MRTEGEVPHRLLAIHSLQPQPSVGLRQSLESHDAMPGTGAHTTQDTSVFISLHLKCHPIPYILHYF